MGVDTAAKNSLQNAQAAQNEIKTLQINFKVVKKPKKTMDSDDKQPDSVREETSFNSPRSSESIKLNKL
jgi:hypothetical protein